MTIGFLASSAELELIATYSPGYGGISVPSAYGAEDGDLIICMCSGYSNRTGWMIKNSGGGGFALDTSWNNQYAGAFFWKFLGAGEADNQYLMNYLNEGNNSVDPLSVFAIIRGATSLHLKASLDTGTPGSNALSAGFATAADHLGLIALMYAVDSSHGTIGGTGVDFTTRVSTGVCRMQDWIVPPKTLYGAGALTFTVGSGGQYHCAVFEARGG